jgi:phage shock protein PspC (stress-responsive transcriptional regulator)
MPTWLRPQLASERHRRLVRRRRGRVLGGVAAGLADHLGVDVLLLRLVFALLVAAGGAGVLLYVGLWIFTPEEPVAGPADTVGGDVGSPGARAGPGEPAIDVPQLAAFAAVAVGASVLVGLLGIGAGGWSVWPVVIAVVGGAVIWRQAGGDRRDWLVSAGLRRRPAGDIEPRAPDRVEAASGDWRRRQLWLARIVGGGALVIVGVAGFLAANHALHQAQHGLLAIVAVVFGLALVTGPWWLRTAGELAAERRERIRTQERAELAARLHDSVLQTLALIQRSADDPREVARLARSQERDLRSWLYRPTDDAPVDRLGSAIEQAAADVEDTYGVPIEVVVVGDAALDERLGGL